MSRQTWRERQNEIVLLLSSQRANIAVQSSVLHSASDGRKVMHSHSTRETEPQATHHFELYFVKISSQSLLLNCGINLYTRRYILPQGNERTSPPQCITKGINAEVGIKYLHGFISTPNITDTFDKIAQCLRLHLDSLCFLLGCDKCWNLYTGVSVYSWAQYYCYQENEWSSKTMLLSNIPHPYSGSLNPRYVCVFWCFVLLPSATFWLDVFLVHSQQFWRVRRCRDSSVRAGEKNHDHVAENYEQLAIDGS